MTALLRIGIVLLSTMVTLAGSLVLAFGELRHAGDHGGLLALGSFALVALAMPPALLGTFVSYWSWDSTARARLRRLLLILVAVQVLGALGLVLLTLTARASLVAPVALIAICGIETPAVIRLGRKARQRELQLPQPRLQGADREILDTIRRGWRRVGIGATIGLVAGVVLFVVLLTAFRDSDTVLQGLLFVPATTGLGASSGGLTTMFSLARRMRDLLGGDFASARRIGLVIKGKEHELSEVEQERADRYAAVAPAWLNFQLVSQGANLLASVSIIASVSSGHSDMRWLLPIFGGLMVLSVAVVVVLRRVQIKRLRAYAATHPVPA